MNQVESSIRPATKEDSSQIIDFQKKLAWETEQERLDETTIEQGVQAVFSDPHKGVYFVIEVAGQVVGCALTSDEWSDWSNQKVMWIDSIYVKEDWRRKGLFTKLFEYLKNEIEQGNTHKGIRLHANKQNANALSVYRALGMDDNQNTMFEWMKHD